MKTITVRDVFVFTGCPDQGNDLGDYCLYVFRDGDFVLYVGRTERYVLDRLAEHVGLAGRGSKITELISDNLPAALDWLIDLYGFCECEALVKKHLASRYNKKRFGLEANWRYSTQLSEHALIMEHRPPLNTILVGTPNKLPERYDHFNRGKIREIFDRTTLSPAEAEKGV